MPYARFEASDLQKIIKQGLREQALHEIFKIKDFQRLSQAFGDERNWEASLIYIGDQFPSDIEITKARNIILKAKARLRLQNSH